MLGAPVLGKLARSVPSGAKGNATPYSRLVCRFTLE